MRKLSIYPKKELEVKIKRRALKEKRSVNNLLIKIIEEYLQNEKE